MKQLIIGITVVLAFHVGNVEAAQWVPLDEAEDGQRIRTNNGPEEGRIICTSKTRGKGKGIAKDGRRLGFLTKKGCKTIGGGDKVWWFTREDGDIMVLVDDEPAVQDVQGQIDAALVGMVSEHDVTPLNCSEGTAVNDAGDACEPTAEYRAAAVEEGRLSGSGLDSILGGEAGWTQEEADDGTEFVLRGHGKPSYIIAYGDFYGVKILVENRDGGWEADDSKSKRRAFELLDALRRALILERDD